MKKGAGHDGENDRELWNYVTCGIKAYHPSGQQLPAAKSSIRKVIQHLKTQTPPLPFVPALQGEGFDRATETRLRRGELPLEGRLDLHGMTQAEAFAALHRFIASAVAQEKRTVLIITGKGQRFEGVLRRQVPQWLEDPALAPYVLALTPAHAKDGGTGAFYLRLRKPRR